MRVRWSVIAIVGLTLALLASNLWWFYVMVDAGVTATYAEVSFQDHREALAELLAVVPVAASCSATADDVLEAAKRASNDAETFEKDGYVWVGALGYRFDSGGRLEAVETTWSPL